VLQGNKKVNDYSEYSYIEGLMQAKGGKVNEMPRHMAGSHDKQGIT